MILEIFNEKEDFMRQMFGVVTTSQETIDYWGYYACKTGNAYPIYGTGQQGGSGSKKEISQDVC